jgi:hypothetical protein
MRFIFFFLFLSIHKFNIYVVVEEHDALCQEKNI